MQIAALRIVIAVVWLTAFMWLRFTAASNITLSILSQRIEEHSLRDHNPHRISSREKRNSPGFGMTYREIQSILRKEGGEGGSPVDCCPSVVETISPTGGRTRKGAYVELYRHLEHIQTFFESSCRADVLNKPCRFVDKKLMNRTRCVQKFSYTYAIIGNPDKFQQEKMERQEHPHRHKDHHILVLDPGSLWRLDYIQVRSGCSCEVFPKPKKKKATGMKAKKGKSKERKPRDGDFS
ncbi:uncharacterized protein [Fopius arisanus]|uniref:Spaetzle domain-containing protein n=1 Tax=Fopius arisanus TaxID=64838 RepID=A0A9R1TKA2_9HYME|nr:PREDICTED: uncharacterized protein LOC105271135 [Fopius arisanus]XP_011310794.1 PREDICTED: uncharacterized protein LOC105271135 [Fopius arisanus]